MPGGSGTGAGLIGSGGGGAQTPQTPISYEPTSGNTITQFLRSTESQGEQAGLQAQKQGLATGAAGLPAQFAGADAVQQVLNYYQNLLGGSSTAVDSALQPQIDPITQQFDQIRQMFSQTGQRGGGQASAEAAAPYQELQTIAGLKNQAVTGAAQGETGAGTAEAGIGQALTQEGLAEQGLGIGQSEFAASEALQVRGQDFQQQAATQSLISSLIGDATAIATAGISKKP